MAELEAINGYNHNVNARKKAEVKSILAHTRDEEKEYAAMVHEWIRRQDSRFAKE